MSPHLLYGLTGLILFGSGLFSLLVRSHPLRKILAANIMSTGVFLVLVATAYRTDGIIDPIPHAMILTGIVVSVSVTALALVLACRVQETSNLELLKESSENDESEQER